MCRSVKGRGEVEFEVCRLVKGREMGRAVCGEELVDCRLKSFLLGIMLGGEREGQQVASRKS